MFGFLKPLLRKLVETPVETEPPPAPDFAPQSFAPAPPAGYPRPARPGRPPQHAVHPQPGRLQPGRTNGKGLELPLQSVLQILPLELQPRVLYPEVGDATISVPLEKILAQLSRGTVKISFGELRMAAPGVFSPENDRDRVLVPLPLEEILVRLNPALITRRRTQRQVEVPMDISSPFDMDGQGLAFSTGPGASSKPEPAPMAAPTARHAPPPAPRQTAPPPPPQPFVPTRGAITSAPTPPPPGAIPMPGPAPAPSRRPVREAASSPAAPIPFSSAPAPAAQSQPARPAPESAPLVVGLTALAESWPEGVRKEIVQWNLVE